MKLGFEEIFEYYQSMKIGQGVRWYFSVHIHFFNWIFNKYCVFKYSQSLTVWRLYSAIALPDFKYNPTKRRYCSVISVGGCVGVSCEWANILPLLRFRNKAYYLLNKLSITLLECMWILMDSSQTFKRIATNSGNHT